MASNYCMMYIRNLNPQHNFIYEAHYKIIIISEVLLQHTRVCRLHQYAKKEIPVRYSLQILSYSITTVMKIWVYLPKIKSASFFPLHNNLSVLARYSQKHFYEIKLFNRIFCYCYRLTDASVNIIQLWLILCA